MKDDKINFDTDMGKDYCVMTSLPENNPTVSLGMIVHFFFNVSEDNEMQH